jgi:hypothetical protein
VTDKRAQLETRITKLQSDLLAAITERDALDLPTVQCEAETKKGVRCRAMVKGGVRCRVHRRKKDD